MNSTIQVEITEILEQHDGEIQGTFKLADETGCVNNKYYLLNLARRLRDAGLLDITPSAGGRGRMTIYRCPFTKCLHCPRLTCARRPTRAQLGYPRRARKPR